MQVINMYMIALVSALVDICKYFIY